MKNLKKVFAVLLVTTFIAAIPLAVSDNLLGPVSVTYKVETVDYYGKPPGTPGGGKPSGGGGGGGKPPSGYSLLGLKWQSLGLTLVINPGSGEFEAGFTTAIEAAAETWDAEVTTELVSSYSISSLAVYGDGADSSIEIVLGDLNDPRIIAQCTIWSVGGMILDFDIIFNTGSSWSWGDATVTPGVMDWQNIATHELGHGFGLGDLYKHKETELTMYGYASEGETKKRDLEAGDIAGIQALYGA